MKVAVLADIHANIAALEPVLKEARREGIKQLVLLGDFVGYYYEPRAVIEALDKFDCAAIRGNHDRMALDARGDSRVLERYRAQYGSGIDAVFQQFGAAEWAWLADLAERTQMKADVVAALARNLDSREARLMRLRYGFGDGQTRSLAQCAQAMGLSESRVQSLAKGCLKKLREAAESESLEEYLFTVA